MTKQLYNFIIEIVDLIGCYGLLFLIAFFLYKLLLNIIKICDEKQSSKNKAHLLKKEKEIKQSLIELTKNDEQTENLKFIIKELKESKMVNLQNVVDELIELNKKPADVQTKN